MAFAVERHRTGEPLHDLRYFKWFAYYFVNIDGVKKRSEIPMRTCTDDDYEEYYPVEKSSKNRLDSLKAKKALICLDFDENMKTEIKGAESQGEFAIIDVMIVPCAVKLTNWGGREDRIPENCEKN